MSDLKNWIAVENNQVVHGSFQATQEYIDTYDDQVVERQDRTTPPWYHNGVVFVDVTGTDPLPATGWYKDAAGKWADGNPTISSDKTSIPGDGVAVATVTYSQKGPKTPQTVTFNVNGQDVVENVTNGQAKLEVSSSNPGDVVVVKITNNTITINVEV
jgi:hypothetical protein